MERADNRITIERLEETARKALLGGYGTIETWDPDTGDKHAGKHRRLVTLHTLHNCEAPYRYELFARRNAYAKGKKPSMMVRGTARCRKCEPCKKARQQMWQLRAIEEYKSCPRTLFGTITMSPDQHYLMDAEIMSGLEHNGRVVRHPQRLDQFSHEELFSWRVRIFGEKLQAYLKRLRKKAGPDTMRYLLVAEAHDSAQTASEMRGRPHFHMLIHEQIAGSLVEGNPAHALLHGEDGEYIRKKYKSGNRWYEGIFVKDTATLREQWEFGYTKFQFAENEKAASYLCKYLSKSNESLVRASLRYGSTPGRSV